MRAGRSVRAAVAANFAEPAAELSRIFSARGGPPVEIATGASGPFAAQITRGAPFDVFLSADRARAQAVARAAGTGGSLFVYAVGRLVLWSRDSRLVDPLGAVLRRPDGFRKLAIADPAAAPYGEAALQTLARMGLLPGLRAKLVLGGSIGQAFGFVVTGAADLGFVALSQLRARADGSRWLVPEGLHAPIVQAAVLTAAGARDPGARAFLAFLRSPPAREVIRPFGYGAPG